VERVNSEKRKKSNLFPFIKTGLRRMSMRWPEKNIAFTLARVERGKYKCAICGLLFSRSEVQADHIDPVVDIRNGFEDWDTYINRLFVPADKYQIICKQDHEIKSRLEDEMRIHFKKKKKRGKK
jgi:hypothetical protein